MKALKIRVYKGGGSEPETTVTIPLGIVQVAHKLLPRVAAEAMREKGIDLEEIARLAADPAAHGTLLEVEEHKKNERVVIALE